MGPDSSGDGWERAFRLVFERSSNGIALVDELGRFVEVNDALLKIVGRTRSGILGTSALDAIPPSEQPRATQEWRALLSSGEYATAGSAVRWDGSTVRLEVAARVVTMGARRLAVFVVTSPSAFSPPGNGGRGTQQLLTSREQEIVTLIALGHETPQIARELFISESTVQTHVRNAMSKLGARTRAQLVANALCRDDAFHPRRLNE